MKTVYLFRLFILSIVLLGVNFNAFSQTSTFSYTGTIAAYTVPAGVASIKITANGAQGGNETDGPATGGLGATISGNFTVIPGHVLHILAGQQPDARLNTGGGGGGSFVWDSTAGTLLIAAGGGGGAGFREAASNGIDAVTASDGTNGGGGALYGGGGVSGNGGTELTGTCLGYYAAGGAGWLTNGADGSGLCSTSAGGQTPLNGGAGGAFGGNSPANGSGGFGGGGGSQGQCNYTGGGGGGGYSGGGGGDYDCTDAAEPGGGGGSFNGGSAQSNTVGNTGNGLVTLTVTDYAPAFVNGSPQDTSVCQNSSLNISGLLNVNDIDTGQTETWSIADSALHGSLTGFNTTALSTGGTVTPAGLIYTPATGYAGVDTFAIQVSDGSGGMDTTTLYVTINPIPNVTTPGMSVCNGSFTPFVRFAGSVPATFNWTNNNTSIVETGTNGIDSIGSSLTANAAFTAVTDTFIVIPTANGCTGAPYNFIVTVNPTPSVDTIVSQSVCNGAATTEVDFTGSLVAGTIYTWTNNDTSIGLAALDTGNIDAFTARDTTHLASIAGLIKVTPIANGCAGLPQSFTITVKPTPVVTPISPNPVYCNGARTAVIPFTDSLPGTTTYIWTNDSTSIGLAASGEDSIPSFIATNDSAFAVAANITVTPTYNGCTSSFTTNFEIIVNPTPRLSSTLTPAAVCNGVPENFNYTPTSATSATEVVNYSWVRNAIAGNDSTGFTGGTIGTDSISNATLVNNRDTTVTVTYIFALSANSCVDTQNVKVNVYPTPLLSSALRDTVCSNSPFQYVATSGTPHTAFTWVRDGSAGISDTTATGATDTVNEILTDTTNHLASAFYVFSLSANGCPANAETVTVTVKPQPMLTSVLIAPSICDSTLFTYIQSSNLDSTTYTWSRAAISGGSAAANGSGDTISEVLVNTSVNPVAVTYMDTLMANGCVNTEDITVTVNPKPVLTSLLTPFPSGLCDSTLFTYTPSSATTGPIDFTWTRPYVLGIGLAAGSGTGDINEQLVNNTNATNLDVVYIYTITANGCSNTQNVTVVVHPLPELSSNDTPSVCSGAPFNYVATGYVFGTTFAWTRAHVAGITPSTASADSGAIHETLTDSALIPIRTTYVFTLTANGCTNMQDLDLTVNPAPPQATITTHSPDALCTNTLYQNFGADILPPAGQEYSWSAANATIYATGNTSQYILVNFPESGDAVITLKSNIAGIGCESNSTFSVNVGSGVSDMPRVTYYNGQFMCLENGDTYQWGYDDAHTLDSTLVPGQVNQTYFVTGEDTTDRYYWVITTTPGGCMQKSYYTVPSGITNVNNSNADVKIYPNPANDYLNVDINTSATGNMEVQVLNMLGQELSSTQAVNNKATVAVASLPAGVYLVECYREGVKIAAARFVKN